MKVAVTGGAGYIGSTLVKRLSDEGVEVTSIDNLTKGDYRHLKEAGVGDGARLLEGDIRDREALEGMMEDSDAIAHLAAIAGLSACNERPELATSVNVYGTHQVLETARRLDIGKVVFCSSAAVYGRPREARVGEEHPLRPLNLYGVTKLAGEKLMEEYWDNHGIRTVSLRFGNVYGVGLYTNYDTVIPKFVRQGLNGDPLTIYGDGESSREFVHVNDIVEAIKLAIQYKGDGGDAFNVGGETMKIGDLANLVRRKLREATGRDVDAIHLPPRPGETKLLSYRLDKIKKALGYSSNWSVERGVTQIMEHRISQMRTS